MMMTTIRVRFVVIPTEIGAVAHGPLLLMGTASVTTSKVIVTGRTAAESSVDNLERGLALSAM